MNKEVIEFLDKIENKWIWVLVILPSIHLILGMLLTYVFPMLQNEIWRIILLYIIPTMEVILAIQGACLLIYNRKLKR